MYVTHGWSLSENKNFVERHPCAFDVYLAIKWIDYPGSSTQLLKVTGSDSNKETLNGKVQ